MTQKVQECTEEFKAQSVGNALYGLQSLGHSAEVRGLVVALTAKEFPKKADEAFAFLTEEVALDLNGLVLDMTVVLVAALLAAAHATENTKQHEV